MRSLTFARLGAVLRWVRSARETRGGDGGWILAESGSAPSLTVSGDPDYRDRRRGLTSGPLGARSRQSASLEGLLETLAGAQAGRHRYHAVVRIRHRESGNLRGAAVTKSTAARGCDVERQDHPTTDSAPVDSDSALDTEGSRRRSFVFAVCLGLGLRVVLTVFADITLAIKPGLYLASPPTGPSALLPSPGTWQALVALPWQRWDAIHYTLIAADGYSLPAHASFLPLFPLLERVLEPVVGGSFAVAGVAANTIALVAGLYLLHRLATHEVGAAVADRTLIWLAIFPTAFFLLANYAEAPFFALSLGAFLAARRRHFVLAGVSASLATLCRDQGILLVVPLAIEVYDAARERAGATGWRLRAGDAAVLLPIVALAAWWAYVSLGLGVAGGPGGAELRYWGDHPVFPVIAIYDYVASLFNGVPGPGKSLILLDLFIVFLMVVGMLLMWRRLPKSYSLYAALSGLIAISREVHGLPVDIARFAVVIFPFFMLAGMKLTGATPDGRAARFAVAAVSCVTLLYLTYRFAHWGYVS
jgi:hypothetical protein